MSRNANSLKSRAQSRKRTQPRAPFKSGKIDSFVSSTGLSAILSILLAVATIGIYSPVVGYSFVVLDDHDYVTSNAHVRSGLNWDTIKWAFTTSAAANWHPLTWLSHALDCQMFGLNAAGHHFDSVLIHALNTVLLFLGLRWLTGRLGPSFLVAALFALHPINVESVAWVSERKNVLSTFFFFAALGAYGWYAQRPQWRRYSAVLVLFSLGLMAKPMVVTLPFVLLLLDYWPLGRTPGSPASVIGASQWSVPRLLLEKVPLLLLSAASALITFIVQRGGYAVRSLHQFSFGARVENAIVAYALYLWKMVWPAHLAIGYPHAAAGLPAWQWLLAGLVLTGITAIAVGFRGQRYLLVGWLWFLGMMVPVIGLVQVGDAAMADRYAYLPLNGVFIMIAWGLADLCLGLQPSNNKVGVICTASSVAVLVALSFVTHVQMSYWDSEFNLWSHTLVVTDNNPFAHDALGAALMDPDTTMSRSDLANYDTDEKRLAGARFHLEQALAIRRELARQNPNTYLPDMAVTLNNLGNLERTENHMYAARRDYEEGLRIHSELVARNLDPYPGDRALAFINLGYLERSKSENDAAILHFTGALETYRTLAQRNPGQYLANVAEALNSLAVTERDLKQMDKARRHYEEALEIRRRLTAQNRQDYLPYLATTLNDLGVFDGIENRAEDARRHYEEALTIYRELARLDPDTYTRYLAGTLNNLAFLYGNENQVERSQADYTEALGLYRKLYQEDPGKYAGDLARVEGSLEQLRKKFPAKETAN